MPAVASDKTSLFTLLIALGVLVVGTMVIAPLRLPLLLIPLSFLLASYGMGLMVETCAVSLNLPPQLPMLIFALRIGTGMSLLGFGVAVFGILGKYRFSAILIIGGLGWAIVLFSRKYKAGWQIPQPNYPVLVSGLMVGLIWTVTWLWATIPPTFYDELAYHLPLAQYALHSDTLAAFPWLFFSFMPHLSDLLLGWGLALGAETGARAMHFMFWLAIWTAGWALVESITGARVSPWIGFLMGSAFASSTTFLFLGTLPFAETSLAFAVLTSAALIVQSEATALWLPLGLLWGLTLSVKLSGWPWVVAGALAAMVMKWPAQTLAKSGLVALVASLPWWGRAWWLTGNPIYPLGYRWLGGLYWTDEAQSLLQRDLPSYSHPFTFLGLLHLPYDMIMAPERFGSAAECGPFAVGMVGLMLSFPLWTLLFNLDDVKRRQCYAASLFMVFAGLCWVMTSTTTRFFAPALMVGMTTLVALLTLVPRPALVLSLVVLSTGGTWGTIHFLSLHDQVFSSAKVAIGQESADAFTRRTLDQYEAAMYVRSHLPENAHILFIGESRPFYFDRASLSPYPYHEHPLTHWVEKATSPEQLVQKIQHEGFTHVVLNTKEFRRLHDAYHVLDFTGPEAARHGQILKQLPKTMTMLFAKNNVYVFEIPLSNELHEQAF